MRVPALAVIALVAATSGVRAETDVDEDKYFDDDGAFEPFPKLSIGVTLNGHGTRVRGHAERGFGAALELALGRARWQSFVEAGLATASIDTWTAGAGEMRVGGRMVRGGLGMRWLARQFRRDDGAGIELFLLSLVGAERYDLDNMPRVTRPELAFGVGLQGRSFHRPRFAFRIDARMLYTPEGDDDSTGFMGGIGFAW